MAEIFKEQFGGNVECKVCTTAKELNFDTLTDPGRYDIYEDCGNGQTRMYCLIVDTSEENGCIRQTRIHEGTVDTRCNVDGVWSEWKLISGSGGSMEARVDRVPGGAEITVKDGNGTTKVRVNDGADGGYYVPSITKNAENAVTVGFTPTNSTMHDVPSVKLTLPRGETGAPGGYYVPGVAQATTDSFTLWFGENGKDMPRVEPVTIYLPRATDGYTPIKGDDYFTAEEIARIEADILASVPVIGWSNPNKGAVWFNSNDNKVSGRFGTGCGANNTIISTGGFAAGANNTIGGIVNDQIYGHYSGTIGERNTVIGNYSTGMGYGTVNPGHYAHTFNRETSTFAGSYYQTAFGYWNAPHENSLFMIGYGTGANDLLNVFEVDTAGTVTIRNSKKGTTPTLALGNSRMNEQSLSKMDALISWGGEAVYLKSPNGTKFKVAVSDAGALTATKA